MWHFGSWLMRGILFADQAHASHLYLLSNDLWAVCPEPHSCKITLLVQVREILWATKQQVEVSTPDTISSAIPPCSEDRSTPIRGDHMSSGTCGVSGVQWQERDDWRSDTDCHPTYPVPSHLLSNSRDLPYGDPDLPKPQLSYISASALDIYYHVTFFIV